MKHATISIDTVNSHIVETIEMLKNNNCSKASKNEKIDTETARVISDLCKNSIEIYKTKAQVLSIVSKTENPKIATMYIGENGL